MSSTTHENQGALLQPEAELSVLGAMIQDAEAARTGLSMLCAQDFAAYAHQDIFAAMQAIHAEGNPVDLVTVDTQLTRAGRLDAAGGVSYLIEIAQYVPTTAHAEAYCREVLDASNRRKAISAMNTAAKKLKRSTEPLGEIIAQVRDELASITVADCKGQTALDAMMEVTLGMERKEADAKTGIAWLDAKFRLRPEELTTLGGRPGTGKSAFALQVACNVAAPGKPALFISVEMTARQVGQRLHALLGGMDMGKLVSRTADGKDYTLMADTMAQNQYLPLYLHYDLRTTAEIARAARHYLAQSSIALLVVDYLQKVKGAGRFVNKAEEVAHVSGALKELAKELKIPVLAPVQLSRDVEKGDRIGGRRPVLADLSDSSAIEKDSDNVLFLYEPNERTVRASQQSLLETAHRIGDTLVDLIIAKQRQGENGRGTTLYFAKSRARMREITERQAGVE